MHGERDDDGDRELPERHADRPVAAQLALDRASAAIKARVQQAQNTSRLIAAGSTSARQ